MTKIGKYAFSLFLILIGITLSGAGQNLEPKFKIRGGNHGNWWLLGQTVNFRALPATMAKDLTGYRNKLASGKNVGQVILPGNWSSVTGAVFDSDGRTVAKKTVSAGTFACNGWSWKPSKPGFYSVEFSVKNNQGKELALYENISSEKGWTVKVPKITIPLFKHEFAVLPNQPRLAAERSCFGVQGGWNSSREELNIIPLIGFDFVRLFIGWRLIEKSKGKFNWSSVDKVVNTLRKLKINCIGTIRDTPRWASSKPNAPGKSIWQDHFAAYVPKNISDYTDFFTALIERYPDIKTWEAWNEPNLPGQSIFWRSSPEEYVTLQKAAYETIKKLQPNSSVWLGGIGMRYLPFYKKIIELGAGKYFDVLPLHGRGVDPEPFNAINRKYGVEPKPWVQGEWHAILFKTAENKPPTETQLSHNMLLDLIVAFQRKVSKVVVWGWHQGAEREFYHHFHAHGEKRASIGGFFRNSPYCEPRLPLVVLCNFVDCFSGKITFINSYAFSNKSQQAALLESSAGKVLFFWQNGKRPVKPASKLATVVAGKSILQDWEGRKLKFDQSFMMRPEMIYFLKNPDMKVISGWKKHQFTDIMNEGAVTFDAKIYGRYRKGPLFRPDMKVIAPESLVWHQFERFVSIPKSNKMTPGLNGRFALGFSPSGMDLLVEMKDKTHIQNYPARNIWEGDSLQFALDAVGKGRPEERIEYAACLTDKGPLLWKLFAPMLMGDLPARYTDPPAKVKYGKIEVDKQLDKLVYKIHISRDDIYPFAYQVGQPIRFSLLANNNDGNGRAGYLEWASGIGSGKYPKEYGTVTVDIGNKKLAEQKKLYFKGKGKAELGDMVAKVTVTTPGKLESLRTIPIPVSPGTVYTLSFSVRGDMDIRVFAGLTGSKTKRMDIIRRNLLKLSKTKWTDFSKTFIFPPGTKKASIVIFSYNQRGFYEVKNFSLTSGCCTEPFLKKKGK